jgi:galactokinase
MPSFFCVESADCAEEISAQKRIRTRKEQIRPVAITCNIGQSVTKVKHEAPLQTALRLSRGTLQTAVKGRLTFPLLFHLALRKFFVSLHILPDFSSQRIWIKPTSFPTLLKRSKQNSAIPRRKLPLRLAGSTLSVNTRTITTGMSSPLPLIARPSLRLLPETTDGFSSTPIISTRRSKSLSRNWNEQRNNRGRTALQGKGKEITGANLLINSDIPNGAGLSSSAALEMATAHALLALSSIAMPALEIIHACHDAEFEFVGVHCGIMDQFISCLAKKNHALFLDCQSLQYEHIPVPARCKLVVCDTGVKRHLAASEYNIRRQQCSEGAQQLSYVLPSVKTLRDVSVKQFEEHKGRLGDVIRKRCRHVIYENERVLNSIPALRKDDLSDFGKLMYQSHMSLKNDYEVSCTELDAVVDICAEVEGVYGARMTGAGFGGAAICLVENEQASAVVGRLEVEYPRMTGRKPTIQVCTIEDGAQVRPWT